MTTSQKYLLTMAGGLLGGALMGVLFAPDKGKVTRKRLRYGSRKFADGLRDGAGQVASLFNGKTAKPLRELVDASEN